MYRRCVTEMASLRQKRLEECLLSVMEQVPYRQISVSDLCHRTEISRKTFYRYYGNKDDCLCSLLDRVIWESSVFDIEAEQGSDSPPEVIQMLLFWKQHGVLMDLLIQNGLLDVLIARSIQHMINEKPKAMQLLKKVSYECGNDDLHFLFSGIVSLLVKWHKEGYTKTDEEMAAIMTRLLSQPLF